jgi:hypothetical protein
VTSASTRSCAAAGSGRARLAFAGRPPGAARAALRAFLAANPKRKHGAIDYRLEPLGLDARVLRERLRFYSERFGVPDEDCG